MYNPQSLRAEEFIDHDEIMSTLEFADKHCGDAAFIDGILDKARLRKGLDHREAATLLSCTLPEKTAALYALAEQIKKDFYGNRIVLFAPLYLSNYCVNSCLYCPYHRQNRHMPRKKLSQEDIVAEVTALQDMGHKRLAIEAGEDPAMNPLEYILESIATIYSVRHRNGSIRRVNVNIAATTVEDYRKLKEAQIGTYILFQETYHKESYARLHPAGPKHDYAWHTEAMDRAMQGGIDDVGLGVLFGLESWRYEFTALLMHAEHLEAVHGVGPHTISVPRVKKADGIDPGSFDNGLDDDIFARICACIRLAVPYTGMIISTRESQAVREKVIRLGVSQISGASRTSVGGYADPTPEDEDSAQFDVSDRRSLDEVVAWLMGMDFIPSFCTACYRQGRTGDRFMSLCKSGQILNCCHPNALMTLKEYLEDYASPDTRALGEALIARELEKVPSAHVREIARRNIAAIAQGKRDFRF
ncbi:MAG: [Desulfovibrio sp.]|nr:[FeFe] hydrogenase H-cluster radical SAM maturase HydG [Desulfovibrio sp.]